MGPSNISFLQRFQLEELSVGSNLTLGDIKYLVLGGKYEYAPSARRSHASVSEARDGEAKPTDKTLYVAVLEPMRAAFALCQFRQRLQSVKPRMTSWRSSPGGEGTGQDEMNSLALRYLDISSLPRREQGQIKQSVLLAQETYPLEVLEIIDVPWDDYLELLGMCGGAGWREKWVGERVWVERSDHGEMWKN